MNVFERIAFSAITKSTRFLSRGPKEYWESLGYMSTTNNYGELFALMAAIKATRMFSHNWKEYVSGLNSALYLVGIGERE